MAVRNCSISIKWPRNFASTVYRPWCANTSAERGRVCTDTGESTRTRAREYLVAILQGPDHPTEFIFLVISPACTRMCAAHTSQCATPSRQFSRGKVNVCGTLTEEYFILEDRSLRFWCLDYLCLEDE